MSCALLRQAANQIRDDYMPGIEWHVADLLDRLADEGWFYEVDHPALAVAYGYLARAGLGGQA